MRLPFVRWPTATPPTPPVVPDSVAAVCQTLRELIAARIHYLGLYASLTTADTPDPDLVVSMRTRLRWEQATLVTLESGKSVDEG